MADQATAGDVRAYLAEHMPATRALNGALPQLRAPRFTLVDGEPCITILDDANGVGYSFVIDPDVMDSERDFSAWVLDCRQTITAHNN